MAVANAETPPLHEPVSTLGVRAREAEKLGRLNIHSVMDALFHLPIRYLDHTRLHAIASLQSGQYACVQGAITSSRVHFRARRALHCLLQDDSGCVSLCFFHFHRQQQQRLGKGALLRCFGTVRQGPQGLQMVHPQYRVLASLAEAPALEQSLIPVYATTRGLRQATLRKLGNQALAVLRKADPQAIELLPDALLKNHATAISLADALHYVHNPPADADTTALKGGQTPAQKRLAYEELLAHKLSLRYLRQQFQKRQAPRLDYSPKRARQLLAQLPFTLTAGQQQASADIRQDLERGVPMMRLLQGDVGAGKTAVAALAALQALDNGWQVAMLTPTEILAEQQHQRLATLFSGLDMPVIYLSGKLSQAERKPLLAQLAESQPLITVGTHALFQETVHFARLGLVVIDEQHRFGVRQRMQLLEKGGSHFPHQLVMTATPIPRTLTMTAYADLDCSVIAELPPGRQQVTTVAVSHKRRNALIERLAKACASGRQAYWVCTLIEESETLPYQTALDTQQELRAKLADRRIGLLHGKMRADEKERKMRRFRDGGYDVLVATTVIEVGVDVPNASLMVIDNAERLGLAQLHQLRGRVGRGSVQSDCVLLYQAPLGPLAEQRLDTLRKTHSGFDIAEQDLKLRGPGELLGQRQTGLPELRIADLLRDRDLLGQVDRGCQRVLEHHPECVEPLIQRWLGQPQQYSNL